jgi:hypothetical protein
MTRLRPQFSVAHMRNAYMMRDRKLRPQCSLHDVSEVSMLTEFCTLKLDSDEEVRINVLQVRCIKAFAHTGPPAETWSRIEFDQYHHVIVKAAPSDVERALTTEDK